MTGIGRDMTQMYERRRDQAMRALDLRRAEALSRVPVLSDLESEIGALGVRTARSVLHDEPEKLAVLVSRLEELKQRRLRLLQDAGFPERFLEPQWHCDRCRDTGFETHPDGTSAGPCVCSRQYVLERTYQVSNISRDPDIGFARYTDRYYPLEASREKFGIDGSVREHMNAVRDHVLRFTERFGAPETRSLYLFGPTGTGKTFLAKCAGKALLEAGKTALYLSSPALFEAARAAKFHDEDQPDAGAAYRRILDANLLILDDLGTEPASDSRYADLLTLLEERARPTREPRRIIIATNMDLRQLKSAYNERISSRIAGDFDILSFAGADIRVLKRYG